MEPLSFLAIHLTCLIFKAMVGMACLDNLNIKSGCDPPTCFDLWSNRKHRRRENKSFDIEDKYNYNWNLHFTTVFRHFDLLPATCFNHAVK